MKKIKNEKNLLNLLLAGGISIAIALGGAGLGVAINNKSKSSSGTNTGLGVNESNVTVEGTSALKKSGIISLYGGFKPLTGPQLRKTIQAVLGLPILGFGGKQEIANDKIVASARQVEILDLRPSVGSIGWIQQQLINPKANAYTDQITVKTLHEAGYKQKIVFVIAQKNKTTFDTKNHAIYAVEVKTEYVAAVGAVGNNLATTESWNLVFDLIVQPATESKTAGVKATSTVVKPNSIIFSEALANSGEILAKGIDVLLWKANGAAKADSTDFEIAIMLDKKTGKVYVYTNDGFIIDHQEVSVITMPTYET